MLQPNNRRGKRRHKENGSSRNDSLADGPTELRCNKGNYLFTQEHRSSVRPRRETDTCMCVCVLHPPRLSARPIDKSPVPYPAPRGYIKPCTDGPRWTPPLGKRRIQLYFSLEWGLYTADNEEHPFGALAILILLLRASRPSRDSSPLPAHHIIKPVATTCNVALCPPRHITHARLV